MEENKELIQKHVPAPEGLSFQLTGVNVHSQQDSSSRHFQADTKRTDRREKEEKERKETDGSSKTH